MMTSALVDIATGNAVTADNDDAVDAVVPPSSTKDEDAYVGAPMAFEDVCVIYCGLLGIMHGWGDDLP